MIRARSLWAACLLLPALCCPSRASIVYVNKHAPGPTYDGASWQTAYTSIRQAATAAQMGDEVWVAGGAYFDYATVKPGTALYGGFAGAETQRDQRDWTRNATILDAKGTGVRGVISINAGSAVPATVDGFTLRNGVSSSGGGVYIIGAAVIANCAIYGNAALQNGIGHGGGIACGSGTVTLSNDLIFANTADQGSGIYYGGGGAATAVNCTIVQNRSGAGGATYSNGTGFLTLENCLIADNESGVYRDSYGAIMLGHCDVYGNAAYNYSGLTDPTGTSGNISVDPKLSPFAAGCHLQPGSPCIDAGDDTVVTAGATDFYGKPRIIGSHVDIGADESDGTSYPNPPFRIWRVSTTGSDANDGSSWSQAKASLSLTLMYAQPGDEVWVAKGTYQGPHSLPSGVGLYGGFAGTETTRSQRNPSTNVSALDGVVYTSNNKPYAWTVIAIAPDAASDTVVDGFTIQHGDGKDGSGVYIWGGSPVISNNVFLGNGRSSLEYQTKVVINGGAIYVAGGSPTITGNSFPGDLSTGNGATNGAGIYVANGTATITNNAFSGCNARVGVGGGLCVAGGTPLISGNTFTGCQGVYGGGVYAAGGLMRDNLVYQCGAGALLAYGGGGGAYLSPAAVAVHNRFVGNVTTDSAGSQAGGVFTGGMCIDNDFEDNSYPSGTIVANPGSVVSRNRIIGSDKAGSVFQIRGYGSTLASNLVISKGGGGICFTAAEQAAVVTNNTVVNIGPRSEGGMDYCGIVDDGGWYPYSIVANNIVMGYAIAGKWQKNNDSPQAVTVANNDAFGNTDNALNLPGPQSGNISRDPLFVNAAGGDYHLQAGSPCIDAGNDAYVTSGDRDVAGAPRIYGAHVDIGAYEYGSPLYTLADAAEVLRVAAGISIATPADVSRLNVVPEPSGQTRLTVADATLIAKWLLN